MKTRTVVALVVVLSLAGGAFVATTAAGQSTSATNVTPGERLSGVIGVQKAELDGDLETRAFEAGLTAADENETARAVYAAREAEALAPRIEALATRLETLREQRANDSISPGAYQAQVAEIATRQRTLLAVANRTNETVSGLPAERLEERNINATRIQRLQEEAARLGGPEVAEIARGIAGPTVGPPDRTGERPGPPGANETTPPANASPGGPPASDAGTANKTGEAAESPNTSPSGPPTERPDRPSDGDRGPGSDTRPSGETDPGPP